eukprot:Phypoly_transcript_26912.p1 GENE.Phypoly_transcript_26912~~Phypoly_transcript_26912.p1  ORF type:complete len:146 (+),score=9.59 Phypoly_transcript_26912:35-472(+)
MNSNTEFVFLFTVTFPVLLIGLAYPAILYGFARSEVVGKINIVAELFPQCVVLCCSIIAFAHYPKYRKSSICNGVGSTVYVVVALVTAGYLPPSLSTSPTGLSFFCKPCQGQGDDRLLAEILCHLLFYCHSQVDIHVVVAYADNR